MNQINSLGGSVFGITGGTGSFGQTMLKKLLERDVKEIRIISRDEEKQDALRRKIKDKRVRYLITDVRDLEALKKSLKSCDYIFHAAALKQVPAGEFFPSEVIKTNILGSQNVLDAAEFAKVKKVVMLSTDKAVYPINAMGMTKALMEKSAQAFARRESETQVTITRYGNVMCSRGSVIPKFIEQLKANQEITVTDPTMTRFLMSLDEAILLVFHAFEKGSSGDLFVRKAPGATIGDLLLAVNNLMKVKSNITQVGIRHGEKNHETLLSSEERGSAEENGEYFKVPVDTRGLNYDAYFTEGKVPRENSNSFTSENSVRLTVEEIESILAKLPEFITLVGQK